MNGVLRELTGELAIVQLTPQMGIRAWVNFAARPLVSITLTDEELSVVCSAGDVPPGVTCVAGWRALMVAGRLNFSEVGILAGILQPLAEAGISIFALSTFDTDCILVRSTALKAAKAELGKHFEVSAPA